MQKSPSNVWQRPDGRAAIAWALAMFGGPFTIVVAVPLAGQALTVLNKDDQNGRDLAIGALIAALAWAIVLGFYLINLG
ncbi:hypothetical protein ACFO5K_24790 [Nocardia halotolerans]|uniref:DUF4190 domain-containing protein n=1 Tax=Nocardia halotolerans TaxID=1755878 RepID=A0ABV8VPK4_9NOCA